MTKLPRGLSGKKVIRALRKAGFYIRRQKSSHVIMRREDPFAQVVVPLHKSIDTGLTVEEFIEYVMGIIILSYKNEDITDR